MFVTPTAETIARMTFTAEQTKVSTGDLITTTVSLLSVNKGRDDELFALIFHASSDDNFILTPVSAKILQPVEEKKIELIGGTVVISAFSPGTFKVGDLLTVQWQALAVGNAILTPKATWNTGIPVAEFNLKVILIEVNK